jgi:hypothetical protein
MAGFLFCGGVTELRRRSRGSVLREPSDDEARIPA